MTRLIALIVAALSVTASMSFASDRYAGYYYPEVTSTEGFTRAFKRWAGQTPRSFRLSAQGQV